MWTYWSFHTFVGLLSLAKWNTQTLFIYLGLLSVFSLWSGCNVALWKDLKNTNRTVCLCVCVWGGVKVLVYGLPSRRVFHLISLTTKHINDCIVAKEVTWEQGGGKEKVTKGDRWAAYTILCFSTAGTSTRIQEPLEELFSTSGTLV